MDRREKLFGELTPWSHANFATDPFWVRAYTYRQQVKPGQTAKFEAVFTNHAESARVSSCRVTAPQAWGGRTGKWGSRKLPTKAEQAIPLSVNVPSDAKTGRHVVAVDVRLGSRELPGFAEAMLDVV